MSDLPDELPSDPAELRAFAAALLDRCARLERLLKLAKDAQFGRSSEKLDADQLQLVLEDIDQAVAALKAAEDRANPKTREKRAAERRANRGRLPEHFASCAVVSECHSKAVKLTQKVRCEFQGVSVFCSDFADNRGNITVQPIPFYGFVRAPARIASCTHKDLR
ncbi:hypothetical protein ACVIN2_002749 [Bradyrhizobium sp. USDA 3650]